MHRIAAAAVWMAIAFTAIVAFQVVVTVDEVQPAGTRTAFDVVALDASSKGVAVETIDAAARGLHRNVYKVQPDPQGSMQGRVLFAFVGDPDAFEARGGDRYEDVSPTTMSTRVLSSSQITTEDLRGRYVSDASAEEIDRMVETLTEQGVEARRADVGAPALLAYSVSQANLTGPFVVILLALGLALSYSAARHRKVYAVRELHGYRRASDVGAELRSATVVFAAGTVVTVVVGLPTLAMYNGLHHLATLARVAAVALTVLYLVVVALVVVAVVSTPRGDVPDVLKGERATVREGVLAAVTQVVVLAVVIATTSAATARLDAVGGTLAELGRWTTGDPLYALRLSTTGTHQDDLTAAPGLAEAITALDERGEVLLVGFQGDLTDDTDGAAAAAPSGARSLLVNDAYLERETVLDTDGRRIRHLDGGPDRFTLLVPQSYPGDVDALLGEYVTYFRDFACTSGDPDPDASCSPVGTVVRTAAGQQLFAYNGTGFLPAQMQERMFVDDPVVAVLQVDSGLLSPMEYLSYASRDDVLFGDPSTLDRELRAHGVAGAFQGIDNAADAVTTSVALSQRQLRMDAVGLVLGWVVLVLSSVVMVTVYCDRRRRPMFVELIHGRSFVERHWRYAVAAGCLSLVGTGVAGVVGNALTHGRDVATAAISVAVQLVVALTAVTVFEARFRADFVKRY